MGQMTYVPSLDAQGYIYVLEFNDPIAVKSNNKVVPGLWECGQHLLCNLRTEKPSLALRPHSQHGFLCRDSGLGATDLWGLVRARITIPTDVARQWINGAEALSRESLFPDRLWDGVYGKILSSMVSNFVMQERMLGRDFGSVTRYDFVDSGADDDRAVIDPEAVRSGQLVGPAAG